jgi:hypothetical protein
VIRLRRLSLPRGLNAVLRRGPHGELDVVVSQSLSPARQRAAVRVALRASRQAGWSAGILPLPVVALLVAAWAALLHALRSVVRAHAVATAAATAAGVTVATGAVVIIALPHHHAPARAGRTVPGQVHPPPPGQSASSSSARPAPRTHPAVSLQPPGRRTSTRLPAGAGGQPSIQPTSAPSPSPATGPSSPAPTPVPSPSPTASTDGGGCIVLLGVWVCL